MSKVALPRDLVKRQLSASRALLTLINTHAVTPTAPTDDDRGLQLLDQLERTSDDLARELYTLDPQEQL